MKIQSLSFTLILSLIVGIAEKSYGMNSTRNTILLYEQDKINFRKDLAKKIYIPGEIKRESLPDNLNEFKSFLANEIENPDKTVIADIKKIVLSHEKLLDLLLRKEIQITKATFRSVAADLIADAIFTSGAATSLSNLEIMEELIDKNKKLLETQQFLAERDALIEQLNKDRVEISPLRRQLEVKDTKIQKLEQTLHEMRHIHNEQNQKNTEEIKSAIQKQREIQEKNAEIEELKKQLQLAQVAITHAKECPILRIAQTDN